MVVAAYLYVYGFWLLLPLLCLAALGWGGWPERIVAFLFLAAAAGSILLKSSVTGGYRTIEIGVLIVDLLLLAGLVWVMVQADRRWLIWVVALQAISTTGHLAKLVTPDLSRMAYALMVGASSYPALLLLCLGIVAHHRARRRGAPDRF
ncbi:MAG TPA: hypothetical protein VN029_09100 [Sphingomonas sp.]|nr:hypothetical protein [Sphingomonas sp.]